MAITVPATSLPNTSDRLPEMLRPLFWDSDFEQISWQDHRDYVVRRVLSAGTWDAVCWLRTRIGDVALRQWIEQHSGRGLSSRQLRFWEVVLDLPHELVDTWLGSEGRRIWEGRGRDSDSEYRHPTLALAMAWPDAGYQIASLDDLALMKLLAVNRRGAKMDFFEVHTLVSQGRPLAKILESFRRKFGIEDVSGVLYSLIYFEDAEGDPIPRLLRNTAWEEVKADIRAWVKAFAAGAVIRWQLIPVSD